MVLPKLLIQAFLATTINTMLIHHIHTSDPFMNDIHSMHPLYIWPFFSNPAAISEIWALSGIPHEGTDAIRCIILVASES